MHDVTQEVTHRMAITIADYGAIRLEAKYIELRGNTYFYRRRIPLDVQRRYPKKKRVVFESLKTSDPVEAARLAHEKAKRQDAAWKEWRSGGAKSPEDMDSAHVLLEAFDLKPGQAEEYRLHGLTPDDFLYELAYLSQSGSDQIDHENLPNYAAIALDLFVGNKQTPFLSEAVELYKKIRVPDESSKETANRDTVLKELYSIAGDIPLDQYSRSHVNELVQRFADSGNASLTIRRKLNRVAPVFSFALREYEIEKSSVFEEVHIPNYGKDRTERIPYTTHELGLLREFYLGRDDDIRWISALMQDTGARLSEILGLKRSDIHLDAETPYLQISENELRPLKTAASDRSVPLVGVSLWAAKRVLAEETGLWAFPRYAKNGKLSNTHASNTQNKSLRTVVPSKSAHCFRHAMRDRLREVECPEPITDEIGGWSRKSVGAGYGQGYKLTTKMKWMRKIVLDENPEE